MRLSLLIHLLSWFRGAARAAVANVYRRFIHDYTKVVTPLTRLTSTLSHFSWSEEAEAVFSKPKALFTSAPILSHPDPSCQFMVEVDASDVSVGPVLSQRDVLDQKLHPCAFFSWRLSLAEANYGVGNRELLAVVLVLQERHHWQVGSALPFVVWMDHKNLAYLRSAKWLNSRQARRALFLGHFDFTLTYYPGPHYVKPGSLSRQFSGDPSDLGSGPIFSPSCIMGSVIWQVEERVRDAQCSMSCPTVTPPNRLFVPDSTRSEILQWGHLSQLTCHPGLF